MRRCFQSPQILKRINPRGMAVGPLGLDGVTANVLPAAQFEAGRCEDLGAWLVLDHHVGFALAHRARAGAAQGFEFEIALVSVIPRNGEDIVHDFDGLGFHVVVAKLLRGLDEPAFIMPWSSAATGRACGLNNSGISGFSPCTPAARETAAGDRISSTPSAGRFARGRLRSCPGRP